MSHGIQTRDRQSGLTQAWHNLTNVVEVVTRENSVNWDVIETPVCYRIPYNDPFGIKSDQIIESKEWKQLIANDDFEPVGPPYAPSYTPSSVAQFFGVIEKGLGDTPYQIVSAGSVNDRCNIFASIKVTDGFRVGDREFKDYITIIDSFDKSTSLTALYSSVCVVCQNTLRMALAGGKEIGKARHTLMLETNIQKLIDAIDQFAGTSAMFKAMIEKANETPCSRDEARAWYVGLEAVDMKLSNGLKQKTARMVELFEGGLGNEGRTRADAFSGYTQFHTRESSRGDDKARQMQSSEWGSSARAKTTAATGFERDWEKLVKRGTQLLEKPEVFLNA